MSKGFYLRTDSMVVTVLLCALFFFSFAIVTSQFGLVTVTFTGQPKIDKLQNKLDVCQETLDACQQTLTSVEEAEYVICKCSSDCSWSFTAGIFLAFIMIFAMETLIKKDKEKPKKKERDK